MKLFQSVKETVKGALGAKVRPVRVVLERTNDYADRTLGSLKVYNEDNEVVLSLYTLELPWRENANSVSRIPAGKYQIKKRFSPKYKTHYHVLDVPNRHFILLHAGNYPRHTKGCILIGISQTDIDGDRLKDISSSRQGIAALLRVLPEQCEMIVKDPKSST